MATLATKYAFIDEFGAFGYDFDNIGCSTHFIITAVIVEDEKLEEVGNAVETIRKKYFQTGEMKSSKIGANHKRRVAILQEIKKLPITFFCFVCDKRKIYENSGLRYKESFYKFLNNLVYKELRVSFQNLIMVADQMGSNDYIKSFIQYVQSKEQPLSLFDKSLFRYENSAQQVIIQVADIISGSLAYNFDEHKKTTVGEFDYESILREKILRILFFPQTFDTFDISHNETNSQYNPKIAEICYRKAKFFIETHSESEDIEIKQQIAILNYLLFRFMNRSPRKYIPTKELINQLGYLGYEKMSLQTFRNKIIAKLRDNEVIISSSKEGYKIPTTEEELDDFINHGKTIIMPMLSRLKKCNDVIRMGTNGEIKLFEKAEFSELASMIESHN